MMWPVPATSRYRPASWPPDGAYRPSPVGDQIADRDQREAFAAGQFPQVVVAGHGPVRPDDLADRGHAGQPGQPGQVDRGLGMAVTFQDAAPGGPDREDVTGPGQVARPGARVGERFDGAGPFWRRDAGRGAGPKIDGDGERGVMQARVRGH